MWCDTVTSLTILLVHKPGHTGSHCCKDVEKLGEGSLSGRLKGGWSLVGIGISRISICISGLPVQLPTDVTNSHAPLAPLSANSSFAVNSRRLCLPIAVTACPGHAYPVCYEWTEQAGAGLSHWLAAAREFILGGATTSELEHSMKR